MPTEAELREYAKKLPDIYRDILAAFPKIDPRRKAGYGLAFQTIAIHFAKAEASYSLDEIQDACTRLADGGFVEIKNRIFAHPTDLGERLIAVVAGTPPAAHAAVPQLPTHTW